jgi:hypothetical protein
MIRIIAKLFAVTLMLAAFLHVAPVLAAAPLIVYVSSTGSDSNPCTAAQPCATLTEALVIISNSGQINCVNTPVGMVDNDSFESFGSGVAVTIDCPGVLEASDGGEPLLLFEGANQVVRIRNLTISGAGGATAAVSFTGSGTLILENCVFENFNVSDAGPPLQIEPNGPFKLVVTNSRISNNAGAGVLIKPASGGSVTATFDGVTITNNAGGLHTDTTNGLVKVDISDSTISNNADNGLAIIGGAGGTNIVNLSHDVIASNGLVGIEASGANAAVYVDTTLLDTNASGATSILSSGEVLSYGNNRIVGAPGSGFTSTTQLQ